MPVNARGTSWQAQVNYKGQRFRKDFATQAEAQRWHDETLEGLKAGNAPDQGDRKPRTVGELIDYVWSNHYQHIASGRIVRLSLEDFREQLGALTPVASVGKLHIDRMFTEWRRRGNSDSTLGHKRAYLSKVFGTAVDLEVIPKKPPLPKFRSVEHRTRVIEPDEERALLGFFELRGDFDMVDLIAVGIDTGMRRGELLKLDPENVQGGMVRLRGEQTKNGKGRSIPLTDRARGILHDRKGRGTKTLFPALSGRKVNDAWNEARAHMGLSDDDDFVPHAMRHTFCSRLGRLGFNAQTIQAMSGHETLEMLKRYTHMDEGTLALAVERLANRFALDSVKEAV